MGARRSDMFLPTNWAPSVTICKKRRGMSDHDDITATRAIPTSGLIRLRGAVLEVVAGPDRGTSVKMETPSLTICKGIDVDLRLTDPAISRRHLEVAATADGLLVRDLGSRNGTWLGG